MASTERICESLHDWKDYSYRGLAGRRLLCAIACANYHDDLCVSSPMLGGAQLLPAEYIEITDLCPSIVNLQSF